MNAHYIPQFQLRYFADGKRRVWVYDRAKDEFRRQSTKTVCAETNYYHLETSDGTRHDVLERWLSDNEGRGKSLIEKLRDNQMLTNVERAEFTQYMVTYWMRTPSTEDFLQGMFEFYLKTTSRVMALDPGRFKVATLTILPEAEQWTDEEFEDLRSTMLGEQKYSIRVDRNTTIQYMTYLIDDLTPQLWERTWLIARPAPGEQFFLTDNPVNMLYKGALEGRRVPAGPLSPWVKTFSPLTPDLAVVRQELWTT